MAAATPPAWHERDYVADIGWPGGRLPIRVELTEVSGAAPVRLAYVRAIRITALPARAASPPRFAAAVSW
jgi:hypothetical protein